MDNRKAVYVDDVIDAIEVYYADRYTLIDNIAELLEKLPSAQPERELGEWVAYGDIPKECPFCGEDWDKYVFGDVAYTGDLPKFCPNCGRMMRGEQDDSRTGDK